MDQVKEIFNKKTLPGLVIIFILLAGIASAVILAQQRTGFLPRALTTNTIAVPGTISQRDGVWNVIIDANTNNGGEIYYLNDAPCNSVSECMKRPKPFEGWTPIKKVGSGNTIAISWAPSVTSVPAGVHTFALFSADGGTILDVKTANFSGGTSVVCTPFAFDANQCRSCASDGSRWGAAGSDFGPNENSAIWCGCAQRYASDYESSSTYAVCRDSAGTNTVTVNNPVKPTDNKWNILIDTNTTNGGFIVFQNGAACNSVQDCFSKYGYDGWTRVPNDTAVVPKGFKTTNWAPPISNISTGTHTFGLFSADGKRLLAVYNTTFTNTGSGAGTISVNDPVRTTGNNWNVVIDTDTTNGGIIYYQNGAPCNNVQECFSKYGYDGWTRIPNNSSTVSSGARTTSWAPPVSNIPAGMHTFGLFSTDEKTLLAVDNTTFVAGSGGITSDSALCKSPGPIFYEEGTTTKAAFVQAGKTYDVVITMENKDPNTAAVINTWNRNSYGLGFPTSGDKGGDTTNFNPNNYLEYWDIKFTSSSILRLPLATNVAPNAAYDFKVKVTAKKSGNNIPFYWRMVHEDVAWFGGECLTQIDITPAAVSSAPSPSVKPSPSPSKAPSPSPAIESTLCFAIGENETQVKVVTNCNDKSKVLEYPSHPTTLPFVIKDTTPGMKTVYVRFISDKGAIKDINKQIIYSPNPVISSITCTRAASGTGTTILVKGSHFGNFVSSGPGLVKVSNKNASINSWTNDTISSTLTDDLTGEIPVEVKIDDGRTVSGTCQVGVNELDFTIKSSCRRSGDYIVENLDIELIEADENRSVLKKKVKTDKDGKVSDLKPNLTKGKKYHFVVSTPYSLKTKVEFSVADGTTVVPEVNLRIGDIHKDQQIGKINAFDVTELYTQWSVDKDVTKLGDFNNDKRINGFDYSCMIRSYNNEDDK